ncbi:hybrid sensor histidine kinase/response regulator [Geomesophilobacter sediminis]|uniref:histidine kinase n=1 Tax=Geomesophilobacter sediminis TaxID=2798584 RepID=A0A8J7JJ55_9BACT|nr:response regulator [Geomesophilobacter sediminis]MBJ6724545.1 response regulator [Geomesophilobacter sediminis]
MTTSPDASPARRLKDCVVPFVLLVTLGVAGNYFKFPVFLNIDFIFGSIFAFLALQFLGPLPGIVAAALISGYTVVLWNHPYAVLILTAEVAAVGWLVNRRKVTLVFADLLYWLVLGMPLVYLCYHGAMHIPLSNTYLTMTKQAINGVTNALVARLIYTGYRLATRSEFTSYRDIVYNLLAFFALAPTLLLLALGSRSDFAEADLGIRQSLLQDISLDRQRLDTWVANRKWPIISLAERAAKTGASAMQPFLEQTRRGDGNFLRIGLLDRDAITVAFAPRADELGHSNLGRSFADRPFIPVLKERLKPMLSEMVMGRIGPPKPVVSVVAPVVAGGRYAGYTIGVLSLDQVRAYLARSTEHGGKLYTLIDKNGNVIMTNRSDQKVMSRFTRSEGTLQRLDPQISQWIPKLPPTTPASERWKKSFYVTEATVGDLAEWKLILEQPIAPLQKAIFDKYTGKLLVQLLILFGALALAEALSRALIATLHRLQAITRDLPAQVARGSGIDWPSSGVLEAHRLIDNFQDASETLATQFWEIQQINETLEQHVEERTHELSVLRDELDVILTNAPIGIAKVVDRKMVWSNRKFGEMFRRGSAGPDAPLAPETALERLEQEGSALLTEGLVFEAERELPGGDGTILTRFVGRAIDPFDPARGTIWLAEDVTRRREAEAEKLAFEQQCQETQRLESLGVLAGGIAHDFNNILAVIIGNCSLARMAPEKTEQHLGEIEKAAERAAALCRQMLEYAGHSQSAKSEIDLRTVVQDMVEMLGAAGAKNVQIRSRIEPVPPVHGDASQIRQIVLNLVINGTEAIGEAQGEIEVALAPWVIDAAHPEKDHVGRPILPGRYVRLEVTDNGCGMNEETRRHIFEPFFSTKFTGRGLGLSATLGIISGHSGALQVKSAPGQGSSFRIYLPARPGGAAGTGIPTLPVRPAAPWRGSGTILLVEDEDQVRDIARTILASFGYEVVEATNGQEALEWYRAACDRINLVITDIGMPVMDGYQLFFELKKINPELPIIVSSGFGDKGITSRIPKEDLAGLITKPYTPSQLQELLRGIGS